MARIAGVDLPREKRAEIGLTYIYGIGKATANEILAKADIDPNVRIKDLSEEQVNELRKIIDNDFLVEGDLRREIALNINKQESLTSYLEKNKILEIFNNDYNVFYITNHYLYL